LRRHASWDSGPDGLPAPDSILGLMRPFDSFRDLLPRLMRSATWFFVALFAAATFFCLGLFFRVLMGPVSLGPFNGELHAALKQLLPILDVRFDDAALEWNRSEGRISLVILGTRVFDRSRRIVAEAPKAEIGLAVAPLLRGRVIVDRIALIGVQLTLVHTKSGALRLGIEQEQGGDDVLKRIRDAIAHSSGAPSTLKSFAVREARLAFYDEESGAFIVAPQADLQVTGPSSSGNRHDNSITANLAARIEISGKPARIFATLNLPNRGDRVTGDLSVNGLDLKALSTDGHGFAFLAPFALTADVTGSWTIAHGTKLVFADFGIGASGSVNGLGRPLHVRSLRLVGRYDGVTGRLLIDDASLAGAEARVHLTGSMALNVDQNRGFQGSEFSLAVDKFALDMPGAMERAVSLGRATFQGVYSAADKSVVLAQARVSGGPLTAALAGRIVLGGDKSPELDLDGRVEAISVRALLPYWPLRLVSGARSWIAANVSSGLIGPVVIHSRIPAGAFQQPAIPDDDISVSFPVAGATINYLQGLTRLTSVAGTVELNGDTFKASLTSGAIGPLSISQGHAVISSLHVHGTPVNVSARVVGGLPQFLALLDMKPLQYPTRFHINRLSARGAAAFDISVRVPTIRGESVDAIAISASGSVNALAIALGPHTQISNGALSIAIDNSRLHAAGKIDLGPVALNVDWTEVFKPKGPVSTNVTLRGTLDDAARATLDLPTGDYLTGPVGLDAHLEGYRGAIHKASFQLALTESTLSADLLAWRKAPGTSASANVEAVLDDGGSIRTADIVVTGPSLTANGTATFAPDGTLQSLAVPSVRAGPLNDFALMLKKQPMSGLDLTITGNSFDGSALGRRKSGTGEKTPIHETGDPFHLSAKLAKLALRDGVIIAPFALDASGTGHSPRTLSANGGLGKSTLVVSLAATGNQRHLTATAGDAALLLQGLLGNAGIKGGDLSLQATLPAATASAHRGEDSTDAAGELIIRNCTVLNQAFLTRAFSSGSPAGVVDLMRGQGIALDSVHIPFRMTGDVISIHDARASGPSIGLTADGYIDRASNQIALQGAIAPLYGLNSLLGAIPVLGDVFVSKKGEGLFGVTYNVSGDLDSPKISTNPLSVLAPGILRRVFEGAAPTAPPASANSSSSTPAAPQTH
jgi:hypothetical protein